MKRIIKIFCDYLNNQDINKLIIDLKKVEKTVKRNWLCIRFNDSPILYTISEIESDLNDFYRSNYLTELIKLGIENKNIQTY